MARRQPTLPPPTGRDERRIVCFTQVSDYSIPDNQNLNNVGSALDGPSEKCPRDGSLNQKNQPILETP